MIRRRLHPLVWFLTIAALMVQSALPVAALAEVNMRCTGLSAIAKPCATVVMFTPARTAMSNSYSAMPCAASQGICPMTSAGKFHRGAMAHSVRQRTSLKCAFSAKPLTTINPAVAPASQRWLLHTAPAMAPPAASPVIANDCSSKLQQSYTSSFVPHLYLTHSHGLRAPPIS